MHRRPQQHPQIVGGRAPGRRLAARATAAREGLAVGDALIAEIEAAWRD
jgi:hypothetical protein